MSDDTSASTVEPKWLNDQWALHYKHISEIDAILDGNPILVTNLAKIAASVIAGGLSAEANMMTTIMAMYLTAYGLRKLDKKLAEVPVTSLPPTIPSDTWQEFINTLDTSSLDGV